MSRKQDEINIWNSYNCFHIQRSPISEIALIFARFPGLLFWLKQHVYRNDHAAQMEWYRQGKTEVLGEKLVPVPLCATRLRFFRSFANAPFSFSFAKLRKNQGEFQHERWSRRNRTVPRNKSNFGCFSSTGRLHEAFTVLDSTNHVKVGRFNSPRNT